MTATSNQCDLHSWLQHSSVGTVEGTSPISYRGLLATAMCYGFRGPSVEYGKNSYLVTALLEDLHSSTDWYTEPHLCAIVHLQGQAIHVSGAFRHRNCSHLSILGEPFANLTCPNCALIPLQHDFRMRVRREDRAFFKRKERSTTGGIRLGYLSILEMSKHSRQLSQKLRFATLQYWNARTSILQLKAKRPTMREMTMNASLDNNVLKFCNSIICVHRTGAFGGKEALWDFLKDVATNLN